MKITETVNATLAILLVNTTTTVSGDMMSSLQVTLPTLMKRNIDT